MNLLLLLAQTTSAPVNPTPPSGADMFLRQILPLVLVVGVFWWFMSRGRSKERQKYQQMLDALKKNDRVQPIGGVLGTVVDVRDNEVLVKVDETNNVKIRFNRTAIKEVLQDAAVESKS